MKKYTPMAQWVTGAIAHFQRTLSKKRGGQAELARRLTAHLRRPIDRAAVQKMTIDERNIDGDEMLAIGEITGFPAPWSGSANQIPVLDKIQAGKLAPSISQATAENMKTVSVPNLPKGDYFALEVEGNSMNRLTPPGSIIIVNRRDKQLIPGAAYVFLVEGETTFKRWKIKPESLDPDSKDKDYKPISIDRKKGFEVLGRVIKRIVDQDSD